MSALTKLYQSALDWLFASLQRQLVLGIIVVVSIMMSLFAWQMTRMQHTLILEERAAHAMALAQTVATSSSVWVASRDLSGLQEIVDGLKNYPDLKHVIVLDLRGEVLAHTDKSRRSLYLNDLPSRPITTVISEQASMIDVAQPVMLGEHPIGWVRIGLGQDGILQRLNENGMHALLFTFLAMGLAGVFALFAAKRLTLRLRTIQQVMDEVKHNNRDARALLRGKDELAQLAHQFNGMLDTLVKRERQIQQSHTALQRSESRLNQIMSVTGEGIWDWDVENGTVVHNARWCAILGVNNDFLEHDVEVFTTFVFADDRPFVMHGVQACLDGRGSFKLEYRMNHANGSVIWVQDRGDVVERDANGKALRMMGSTFDVTAQKQAEAELRIAAVAFESQEGMCITDAQQRILQVNKAFCTETGYTAEEVLGRTPRMLQSGRHSPEFYRAMWARLNRTGAWQGEVWNRRKSGEVYPEWLTISAVKNELNEVTHYVASMLDITERKAAEEAIENLAYYDPLTHLPNRRLLMDRLHQAISKMARDPRLGALMFIDLDNFKTLNDTLGHDVGDQLLQQVAKRLLSCVRDADTVARLGGDEFVVMLCQLDASPSIAALYAETIAEKVLSSLNKPYKLLGHNYGSTPSIGVTLFVDAHMPVEELLKRADLAMYQAKAMGRNGIRFYDPAMQAVVTKRANLELDLRHAIQTEQFALFYQKQVNEHGVVQGVEALIRWEHPVKGFISPAEFIPLAEETGLIIEIGDWVMRVACAQLVEWSNNLATAHLTLSVNVSARQFLQTHFVDSVLTILAQSGAPGERLKLELTESMLLTNVDTVIEKMAELKRHGIGFSLDDFGTGYSSLSYLKRLPLDQLKIDQSFVRDIIEDPNDAAIAQAVIALAASLGLAVIAEGVETEAQKNTLLHMGCHYYQGYFFGRPQPIAQLNASLLALTQT